MIVKRLIQILSAIGAIDAAYLTWQHITASGQCGGGDCNAVLSSTYATVFGLPVAVFGLGLYLTLFYISTKKECFTESSIWLNALATIGFITSIYFTYVQVVILDQLCPFCLLSAILLSIIWWLSLLVLHRKNALKSMFSPKILNRSACTKIAQCFLLPLFIFFALSFFTAPTSGIAQSSSDQEQAQFASKTYTADSIDEALGLGSTSIKKSLYDKRLAYVENELFKYHAKKEKMSVKALSDSLLKTTTITVDDAEITTFYNERKEQFKDQSLASLREPIRKYLLGKKQGPIQAKFMEKLKKTYNFSFSFRDPSLVKVPPNPYASSRKGPKDAPIQIVEFSDLECPHCKNVHKEFTLLSKKMGDKIAITFRHFPLDSHVHSKAKAAGAACANEQGKLWEYLDIIFQDQTKPTNTNRSISIARQIGLNTSAFQGCLSSKGRKIVEKDLEIGKKLGIVGTPTVFINDRLFIGVPTEVYLEELIEKLKEKE